MPRGSKSTAGKVLKNTKAAVEAVLGRFSESKKKPKSKKSFKPMSDFIGPLARNERRWDFVKSNVSTRGWREGTKAPASVVSRLPHLGMADIKRQKVSWLTGYVYVGNGTLGQTDGIYFRPALQTTNIFIGNIPVLGSDLTLGAAYLRDIEKHFARKIVHSCNIKLHALQPSTANSMEVLIAPVRGSMNTDDTISNAGAGIAGLLYSTVAGMSRVMQAASWEEAALDMAAFIAEGSGGQQNEYSLDAEGGGGFIGNTNTGRVPCAFAISGINGSVALRGTNTHSIIIEQEVSYLDFVGDNVVADFPNRFDWMKQLIARREMQQAIESLVRDRKESDRDVKENIVKDSGNAIGSDGFSVRFGRPVPLVPALMRAGSGDSVIVETVKAPSSAVNTSSSHKEGSKRKLCKID